MKALAAFAAASLVGACAVIPDTPSSQDQFFQRLLTMCGRAYEGRVTSPPTDADRDFAASRLVMHVASCTDSEIRIPFHVGENRSRTWVISRTAEGLRLKHDHRHEDGSEDELTQYGGDAPPPGTARRQEFPADAHSRALFERRNIPQSIANVWAVEIDEGRMFAYELRRPNRFFRVEFDLTRPAPLPPAPWGSR
ncbi:hypothetical protein [Allosphingosinicella sp.]|jgi:hypothetical protein|uniref:hypothetical protein n=1 Tax=Allosphingosinicella sp. TaxID=2823234 RepID=UPI002F0888FD